MMIPSEAKIEIACSDDGIRSFINEPVLEIEGPEGPHLVATDGHILAVVPVILSEGDVPGYVPKEALQRGRKAKRGKFPPMSLIELSENHAKTEDGVMFPRGNKTEKFPAWRTVVTAEEPEDRIIAVDVELLRRAAEAIGSTCVMLRLKPEKEKPITVTSLRGDSKAFAVVMPMRA